MDSRLIFVFLLCATPCAPSHGLMDTKMSVLSMNRRCNVLIRGKFTTSSIVCLAQGESTCPQDPKLIPIADLLERGIVQVFSPTLLNLTHSPTRIVPPRLRGAQVWRKSRAPPYALSGGARGAGHSAETAGDHSEPEEIFVIGTSHLSPQSAADVDRVVDFVLQRHCTESNPS